MLGRYVVSSLVCESVRQEQSYSGTWLTTTHRIKKELSICQSLLCLDLVSFPVLSQITFDTSHRPTHFLVRLEQLHVAFAVQVLQRQTPFQVGLARSLREIFFSNPPDTFARVTTVNIH